MKESSRTWSRRDFLAGSVAGLGVLGTGAFLGGCAPQSAGEAAGTTVANAETSPAAGEVRRDKNGMVLMDDWLGSAPEFADSDIDEELKADIIVVGGGIAGVSAARAAAEDGSTVILFEKCADLQCRNGEFATIGSKIYKEHWDRENLDIKADVVDELMRISGNRANQRILNLWADHSGEAFDWFVGAKEDIVIFPTSTTLPDEGVTEWLQPRNLPAPEHYELEREHYKCFFTCTAQFAPNQEFAFKAHAQKAMDTGNLTQYLKTSVKKLLREDDGPVTGVIAQEYKGKTYRATAEKGVILCAGDYASNVDMRHYYNPWLNHNADPIYTSVDPEGNMANTGDGHIMGMWVGAKMEEGPHAAQTHNEGGALGVTAFLEVDFHGKRIGNEDVPAQEIDNRLHSLYKCGAYQIFDAAWVDEVPYLAPSHVQISTICTEEESERNYWMQPNFGYAPPSWAEKCVEEGKAIKADTLEELIDQLDELDDEGKETLKATIEKYNASAKAGVDEEFNKRGDRMFAIENPPYYATQFKMQGLLPMMSGLEVDEEFHVLDENREVIPHLYAAGNNAGGRFAGEYPVTAPGLTHGSALTFGMLAGRNASQGL